MSTDSTIDEVGTDELEQLIRAGDVTVVDALPPRAFDRRHLPTAVNVTAEDDDAVVVERLPRPTAPIAVYSTDDACERAPELADRLRALGYTDLHLYAAGIEAWVDRGLAVEKGV